MCCCVAHACIKRPCVSTPALPPLSFYPLVCDERLIRLAVKRWGAGCRVGLHCLAGKEPEQFVSVSEGMLPTGWNVAEQTSRT